MSTGEEPTATVDLPHANAPALDFLSSIDEKDIKRVSFSEELGIFSESAKSIGSFKISVSNNKYDGIDCLMVHASSNGILDNIPCGTSVLTQVSKTGLVTLEQEHHEYIKLEDNEIDRKTLVKKTLEGYEIIASTTDTEGSKRNTQSFSREDMNGFISEGSNLILQRLFILKGLPDDCQFVSLDSAAKLCPVSYSCLEKRTDTVDEKEIETTGIERTIHSTGHDLTSWHSYYNADAFLVSRIQLGSPATMKITAYPTPVEDDDADADSDSKPIEKQQSIDVNQDPELYSLFVDKKHQLKAMHATYLRDHPEVTALMADFLQFVLVQKPHDIISFAAEYFSSFSIKAPFIKSVHDSSTPDLYPENKTNSNIDYLSRVMPTTKE